jgi:hypothetical protein
MKKSELTKRQACEALAIATLLRDAAREGDFVNVVFHASRLPECIIRTLEPHTQKKALLGWSFEIQQMPDNPTTANWLRVGYTVNPKDTNDAATRESVRTLCRNVLEPAGEWVNWLERTWPALTDATPKTDKPAMDIKYSSTAQRTFATAYHAARMDAGKAPYMRDFLASHMAVMTGIGVLSVPAGNRIRDAARKSGILPPWNKSRKSNGKARQVK